MRQEYLRAAAEAYANIHEVESDCYHYLNDGFDTDIQSRLLAAYSAKLLTKSVPKKYISRIVCTALAECQYPIDEVNDYAWSGNERIAFSGIPKRTWIRHQLSEHVDFILKNMSYNAVAVKLKIQLQVTGY